MNTTNGYPSFVVSTAVPPPKTRRETRWVEGEWRKRYANGWRR